MFNSSCAKKNWMNFYRECEVNYVAVLLSSGGMEKTGMFLYVYMLYILWLCIVYIYIYRYQVEVPIDIASSKCNSKDYILQSATKNVKRYCNALHWLHYFLYYRYRYIAIYNMIWNMYILEFIYYFMHY
jgi:hypothetical protein